MDATVARGRRDGLIAPDAAPADAAIDSTGMAADRRSIYYARRSGRKHRRFPEISAVADTATHLCLALSVERGPGPDDPALRRTVNAARRRLGFDTLLADAGYDGEHHHRWLSQRHGVVGVIPPTRGRPPNAADHEPPGFFRRWCKRAWEQLKPRYGQRWQVETLFSMLKRKLGDRLRARKRHPIDRECHLRLITLNLMILGEHARSSG